MESIYKTFNESFAQVVEGNCLTETSSGTSFCYDLYTSQSLSDPFLETQSTDESSLAVTVRIDSLLHRLETYNQGSLRAENLNRIPGRLISSYKPTPSFSRVNKQLYDQCSSTASHSTFFIEFEWQNTDNKFVIQSLLYDLETPYKQELVDRLIFLDTPNEDPNDHPMILGSLKHFINFIKAHNPSYPEIFLTPDGLIRSEWFKDKKHYFFAEFLPDGFIRYSSGIESEKDPNIIERTQGKISIDRLIDTIRNTGSDSWCL